MLTETKAEMDAELEMSVRRELEIAKQHGLEAVKKMLGSYREKDRKGFVFRYASTETINQLIFGKFRTYDEMMDFEDSLPFNDHRYTLLLRKYIKKSIKIEVYYLETIFYNEY